MLRVCRRSPIGRTGGPDGAAKTRTGSLPARGDDAPKPSGVERPTGRTTLTATAPAHTPRRRDRALDAEGTRSGSLASRVPGKASWRQAHDAVPPVARTQTWARALERTPRHGRTVGPRLIQRSGDGERGRTHRQCRAGRATVPPDVPGEASTTPAQAVASPPTARPRP